MKPPFAYGFGWDGSSRTERKRGGEWGVRISIPAMSFAYGFGWDGSSRTERKRGWWGA